MDALGFEAIGINTGSHCRISFVKPRSAYWNWIQRDEEIDEGRAFRPRVHGGGGHRIPHLKLIEKNIRFETDHIVDIPELGSPQRLLFRSGRRAAGVLRVRKVKRRSIQLSARRALPGRPPSP